MDRDLKDNLKNEETWKKALMLLLFVLCYAVAEGVATGVMLLQLLWVLSTGKPNPKLSDLGYSLAHYFQQIVLYVTWNSEVQPWPIGDWPKTKKK